MDHRRDTAGLLDVLREAFGAEELGRVHEEIERRAGVPEFVAAMEYVQSSELVVPVQP
ncbi:hypothetical protein [Pseudonocardia sp.]|uniref:hypothetical protein n=1 Tax=Pseudonocardia sp. TaxID=60912 RepID=UPI002DAA3CF5|nr:hypothetical protein [Pseudonocardia sp.]